MIQESTTLWITSTQICQASLPHIKVFPTAQTKFSAVIIYEMPKSYLINGIHHYGMPLIVFFGALKERFLILLSAPPYPLRTQVKSVVVAPVHCIITYEGSSQMIGFSECMNRTRYCQWQNPCTHCRQNNQCCKLTPGLCNSVFKQNN